MIKKAVLCVILAMSVIMCSFNAYAADGNVKYKNVIVNIAMGTGQTKYIGLYTNNDGAVQKWTVKNKDIVSIDNEGVITALKNGTTTISGKSEVGNYSIKIKVVGEYRKSENWQKTESDYVRLKADGLNIETKDITMGPNSSIRIADYVIDGHTKYTWRTTNKSTAKVASADIKAIKEGTAQIIATESAKDGKKIYKFNVTVDSNCVTKQVTARRNTTKSMKEYIGNDYMNYVYSIPMGNGVAINNGELTVGAGAKAIVEATSTNGGKNYTLVIKSAQ